MNRKNGFRLYKTVLFVLAICLLVGVNYAAPSGIDKAEVPLTNPSKPALLKVSLVAGSIHVTGYSGKTVLIEAKTGVREKDEKDEEDEEDVAKKAKDKAKGMIRIQNTSTGLTVIEENNTIVVRTTSWQRRVDLTIKVPYKTNLKLRSVNDGKITVEKVDGDLEVKHTNGPLTLTNVSGTVVANTINGDTTVIFDRADLDKPMSISSFNGDVDVTFPANVKFNLKMKSDQGDIYSDFQLKMQALPAQKAKKTEKKDGKFKIRFDKAVYGLLNGGGEEVELKTFNGDIYIRKKK
jgi:hypothetical protein